MKLRMLAGAAALALAAAGLAGTASAEAMTPPVTVPAGNDGSAVLDAGSSVATGGPAGADDGSAVTRDGQWRQYDINIPAAGQYDIGARVASADGGGRLVYALGSASHAISSETLAVPKTGGAKTWITEAQRVTLPKGRRLHLFVRVDKGGFSLDRLTIAPAGKGWAKIVGFGSSYSAGPGVAPFSDPNSRGLVKNGADGKSITCQRSQKNQVNDLAAALHQRDAVYDASCPGDISDSIANPLNADGSASSVGDEVAEASEGYRSSSPGAGALGTGTTTVTVGVGGNDVYTSADGAHKGSVTGAMYSCYQTDCVDAAGNPTTGVQAADITEAALTRHLRPIVDQIRAKAPNARIRFISYPSVFGTGEVACSGKGWEYTTAETAYLQGLLNQLTDTEQKVLDDIAAAEGLSSDQLQLVDIREQSQAHHVCAKDGERWIAQPAGDTGAAGIHPKAEMFALEASLVRASL